MTPPLDVIGDIANPTLTELVGTETVTWETATDWDNAVDENGTLVHDVYGNITDDTILQLGYRPEDVGGTNLVSLWPCDDTGTNDIPDVAGPNSMTNTVNSPAFNQPGIWGRNSVDFDSETNYAQASDDASLDITGDWTVTAWYYRNGDTSGWDGFLSKSGTSANGGWSAYLNNDNPDVFAFRLDGNSDPTSVQSPGDNQWVYVGWAYGGSTARVRVNGGNATDSISPSGLSNTNNDPLRMAANSWSSSDNLDGRLCNVRLFDRALSNAEIDAGYGPGRLTTATKTFGNQVQPDLVSLDYTLSTGTIDLNVIGSPGTGSEEIVSQSLDGSASYTLSWTNFHTDFRIEVVMDWTSITDATPTLNSMSLEG